MYGDFSHHARRLLVGIFVKSASERREGFILGVSALGGVKTGRERVWGDNGFFSVSMEE